MDNLAMLTDSYKASHYLQFPADVKYTSYYIESRGGRGSHTNFFGLQYIIKKYLTQVPTVEQVGEATVFWREHGLPFNLQGWLDIAELGYFPLSIIAVPEGSRVPISTPLVRIENTLPGFHWLPGWLESLLMQVWYPTTVCTISWECKQIIKAALEETGDVSQLPFKLHDFGFRGCTSLEQASIGGAAHLVNFSGTDTVPGIHTARKYYGPSDIMPGFSVPAAEHSTITSWTQGGEEDAYRNMLDRFLSQDKLVAVVSDSYDYWNALKIWGTTFKERIMKSGGTVVIRPDSGVPAEVVTQTCIILDEYFGSQVNDKGYKVLHPSIRVIQGDGISSPMEIQKVINRLRKAGYSADNVAFGMGAGLLQKCDRDTYRFAMKLSAVNKSETDMWIGVNKNPVDCSWKASKAGRQHVSNGDLVFRNGVYVTVPFQRVRDNANRE